MKKIKLSGSSSAAFNRRNHYEVKPNRKAKPKPTESSLRDMRDDKSVMSRWGVNERFDWKS